MDRANYKEDKLKAVEDKDEKLENKIKKHEKQRALAKTMLLFSINEDYSDCVNESKEPYEILNQIRRIVGTHA